jgi:hypothetical protein
MRTIICSLVAFGAALVSPFAVTQDRLDAAGLKGLVEGLGYELRPLNEQAGKEKWEFKVSQGGLDIPIGIELSASKNYIWLTVLVSPNVQVSSQKTELLWELLKENASIQPSQFYVSNKDSLMVAIAVENRAVTPAVMKRVIDKLSSDVASTKDLWGAIK